MFSIVRSVTPSGRSRGHSADDVARTALRILDDDGLADLTMRRLATRLDVQPSALYWHFPNKQSLLAELSDRIVGRAASLLHGSGVVAEARALRDALLAYRDGAEVVSSTLALGLGSPAALDRLTAAVAAEGFSPDVATRAGTTLLHFVLGHVWHEQQRLQYDSVGVVAPGATPVPDADFAFGVDLIHRGLHAAASARPV